MSAGNGKRTDYLPPPPLTAEVDVARLVSAIKKATTHVERKAYDLQEAAECIGVSDDFFRQHVQPDLRLVRKGRKRLVPATELDRWLQENAARALEE